MSYRGGRREDSNLIALLYWAQTAARIAVDFLDELESTVVADLTGAPGSMGVVILYRVPDETADFVVLTLWDSAERVQPLDHPVLQQADAPLAAGDDGRGPYNVLVRGDLALGAALGLP